MTVQSPVKKPQPDGMSTGGYPPPQCIPEGRAQGRGCAQVFPDNSSSPDEEEVEWDSIAGYKKEKQQINETLLMMRRAPKLFHNLLSQTRKRLRSRPPTPKALLLHGPAGTGKTTIVKALAQNGDSHLLYLAVCDMTCEAIGRLIGLFCGRSLGVRGCL